ncbi:unnamed protein product [Phytophthora lilii]|uniref:Unnamed protein product n=1 Tax=Phytophthora lilii TaxID=2077276 RepID=A0A9W6T9P9_9STRA|nr:unnamed protein product [Phytophthora lilii]
MVNELYKRHKELLYFNRALAAHRVEHYSAAIRAKGAPLASCWAFFVDGTKQYVARPSARSKPASKFEIYGHCTMVIPDDTASLASNNYSGRHYN